VLGPQNKWIDLQNPDLLAPPSTDHGSVYAILFSFYSWCAKNLYDYSANAKWPFGLSHNRLQTGGWARQQNGKSISVEASLRYG